MTTARTRSGKGSGAGAGFVGSLAHTPLAEVLRRIAVDELSGDLQVTTPSAIKTIYFDRGFVVFASSNLKNDRLGERMIEAGRISRHEFALASMLMKSTKQKFGKVLVDAGIVAEEELGRHVAAQVNRIVLSLFAAKRGMYSFDERPCAIPVELMVSLSVYRILIEGVRRMSSKRLVVEALPPLDTDVRLVPQPPFTLDVDKLRPEEKAVLRAARDGVPIRSVVGTVGGHQGVALRACYGLLCGGVLETVEPQKPSPILRVQEETGTFVLSEIRRKVEVEDNDSPHIAEVGEPVRLGVFDETGQAEPVEPPQLVEPPATRKPAAPIEPVAPTTENLEQNGVLAWLSRLWNALLEWLGLGDSVKEPPQAVPPMAARRPTPRSEIPVVTARPPEAPRATTEPDKPKLEPVGVPSWSMKDDESEPESSTNEDTESVGVPEWSLKSDEVPEPPVESLGAPAWSMKDDPVQAADPVEPEVASAPAPPDSDEIEPPAWSIMHAPGVPDEEEPLETMDSELFIEGALTGDEPSMMSQVPVERIELHEESLAIDVEDEVEIEVDVEVEAEEEPHPQPPAPEPAPEPEPVAREARASRPAIETDADVELEPEPALSTHEQEMRRMKQSGGEQRLLRDVKLHFKMHDWQGAVPLLEQLVAISPGKALYRGMLGRAMWRNPATRKDAEEHLIEALRLSPQDPELHYWLGLYYKSFGLKSRAITEFRTTLRINPRHEGARKQLGGGGKKDDVLGNVMKKLFG